MKPIFTSLQNMIIGRQVPCLPHHHYNHNRNHHHHHHRHPLLLHSNQPWRKALFLLNLRTSLYRGLYFNFNFNISRRLNMANLGRGEGNASSFEDSDSIKAFKYNESKEPILNGYGEAKEPYLNGYGDGRSDYDNVYNDLTSYTRWKLGSVIPNAYKVREEEQEREERPNMIACNVREQDSHEKEEISMMNAYKENSKMNAYKEREEVSNLNAYKEREEISNINAFGVSEELQKEESLIMDAYKVRGEETYKKPKMWNLKEGINDELERLMNIGIALLREGEEGLYGGLEVGIADRMLREASFLFASASSIDPSNTIPINALGNTLLLRGQLKLLLTEELSEILSDSSSNSNVYGSANRRVNGKDKNQRGANGNVKNLRGVNGNYTNQRGVNGSIRSSIPKICNECEGLLVEAGRKYHMVLLMNKMDEHAMYCWGLALFFRGRLIGAHDQEGAVDDAKKVYQASIAKFEAVVALNKSYVPSALLYWGLALRDQAWLYQIGIEEKTNLLKQAREVLEDVIRAYPSYALAKLAAAACTEDLKHLFYRSTF